MEGYGQDHRIAQYIRHLERGAATHASYAQVASEQAVAQSRRVDQMAGAMQVAAEDGEMVDAMPIEIAALRGEILELQASIHTVGLSICLVGLTIAGALGKIVPSPPEVQPLEGPDA